MSPFSKPIVNEASSLTVKEGTIDELYNNSQNVSDIQQVNKNDSIISQILDKIFDKEALSLNENIINENNNTTKDSDNKSVDNRKAIENSEGSLKEIDNTNKNEDSQISLTENDLIKNHLQNVDGISTHIGYKDSAEHLITTLNVIDVEEDTSTPIDTNKDIKNNIDSKNANENTEATENQIEAQSEDTLDDNIKKVKFSNLNIGNKSYNSGTYFVFK